MIAYLRGRVAAAGEGRAVIEVGGVGFQLFISSRVSYLSEEATNVVY